MDHLPNGQYRFFHNPRKSRQNPHTTRVLDQNFSVFFPQVARITFAESHLPEREGEYKAAFRLRERLETLDVSATMQ
jgi:hypothetical protein